MALYYLPNPCSCGSGLARRPAYDARGIFLTYLCDRCRIKRLRRFRHDVLTDPNYPASEPIEEDC